MRVKYKAYIINNSLAIVSKMETVPNEKGRLQIHFKLIRLASYLVLFLINKSVSHLEYSNRSWNGVKKKRENF